MAVTCDVCDFVNYTRELLETCGDENKVAQITYRIIDEELNTLWIGNLCDDNPIPEEIFWLPVEYVSKCRIKPNEFWIHVFGV